VFAAESSLGMLALQCFPATMLLPSQNKAKNQIKQSNAKPMMFNRGNQIALTNNTPANVANSAKIIISHILEELDGAPNDNSRTP